jgi:hypothetical protein
MERERIIWLLENGKQFGGERMFSRTAIYRQQVISYLKHLP